MKVNKKVASITEKVTGEAMIDYVLGGDKQNTAGSTPKSTEQEQRVEYVAKLIKGSLRWRMAYFTVRFIMVLESVVWTIMDILRAWRMRVSARINDNYQAKK